MNKYRDSTACNGKLSRIQPLMLSSGELLSRNYLQAGNRVTHRCIAAPNHEASYRQAVANGRRGTYPVSNPVADPASGHREALTDHLGSWDLEDAMPTGFGLELINQYVAGETELHSAIAMLKEHDPNGGHSRHSRHE